MNRESSQSANLAEQQCQPCKGGVDPLKGDDLNKMIDELNNDWQIIEEHHLEKQFKFKNFKQALDFVNQVGELAESIGHHPDIYLTWGKVKITVWTHKIDGLHNSDFIFAAKTDRLYSPPQ